MEFLIFHTFHMPNFNCFFPSAGKVILIKKQITQIGCIQFACLNMRMNTLPIFLPKDWPLSQTEFILLLAESELLYNKDGWESQGIWHILANCDSRYLMADRKLVAGFRKNEKSEVSLDSSFCVETEVIKWNYYTCSRPTSKIVLKTRV